MRVLSGAFLIMLSAASYATLPIFTKLAYEQGITLNSFLFYRFFFSFIIVLIIVLAQRQRIPSGKNFFTLFLLGAVGYSGQAYVYLSAVKYASPGLVAILLYLYPAFVALISILILKERVKIPTLIALVSAFIGTALVVGPSGGEPLGFVLAISAAMIYSVYITINARFLRDISGTRSMVVIFGSATIVVAFNFFLSGPIYSFTFYQWMLILGCVVIATVIPGISFLEGLKRIGPIQSSLLSTLEPLTTVLLSYLVFREALTPQAMIGAGLILGTVVMLNILKLREFRNRPNIMENGADNA